MYARLNSYVLYYNVLVYYILYIGIRDIKEDFLKSDPSFSNTVFWDTVAYGMKD